MIDQVSLNMVKKEKTLDTKQRLILAAEKLYAEHGFNSVSLRQITENAQANVASVNYHFGSMEALADIVITRHISPVNDLRLRALKELRENFGGDSIPLRQILMAFMRPMMEQMQSSRLRSDLFGKIMGQCMGQKGQQLPYKVEQQMQDVIANFIQEISAALPQLSKENVIWRLHYSFGVIAHTLLFADRVELLVDSGQQKESLDTSLERIIDYCEAGLLGKETQNDGKE